MGSAACDVWPGSPPPPHRFGSSATPAAAAAAAAPLDLLCVTHRSHASHPWHDLDVGEDAPNIVNAGAAASRNHVAVTAGCRRRCRRWPLWPLLTVQTSLLCGCAVIEIPRGSKVKYELDKKSGAQLLCHLSGQNAAGCAV